MAKQRDSASPMWGNDRHQRGEIVEVHSRSPSRGKAFVYVFPCRHEDILKLGFSRDPLARLQALHPRYYEFFDLDRALLIHTDRVSDSLRLEAELGDRISLHNAPAPLVVPHAAAGYTEWYRGAYETLLAQAMRLHRAEGYAMDLALLPWIRRRLEDRAGTLYAWSEGTLQAIQAWQALGGESGPNSLSRVLRDALGAYDAAGLDPSRWISAAVWRWYQEFAAGIDGPR
ncbi:MAG: GIY-YIG nuclease family protein [Tahibacter sp.]